MSKYISKSHNKTMLLYHLVCTVKYRKDVLTEAVTNTLVNVCMEIEETSDIDFLEIGTDVNHVHFLIQTTPSYSGSVHSFNVNYPFFPLFSIFFLYFFQSLPF